MANTRPAGRQEFYTIRGTNKIVRVGDTVLMKSSKNGMAPWPNVGCVMKFEYYPTGEIKNVRVRYYYRPEEVFGGRKKFHGAKELFLSGHYDVQSAYIIEGTCIVYNFRNYIKLEDVRPEDFYCRFEYNVCTRAFIPDRVQVYCKCELPRNPDKLMVKCEGCRDLYHPACVEMTIEQAEQLDSYMCSDCEPKDNIRKPSSAFSNGKDFEEELERAQNLSELHVAGKSVSGKRKRYSDGCRPAQQVALDVEEDKSSDSPIVKQLKHEVKELHVKLGDMTSQLEALQAHVAMISKHIGFSRPFQAPSEPATTVPPLGTSNTKSYNPSQ